MEDSALHSLSHYQIKNISIINIPIEEFVLYSEFEEEEWTIFGFSRDTILPQDVVWAKMGIYIVVLSHSPYSIIQIHKIDYQLTQ